MAILRLRDIRAMSPEQIRTRVAELRLDYGAMKSAIRSGGAPENTGKMREIRRTIARLLTVLREKGEAEAPASSLTPEVAPVAPKASTGEKTKKTQKVKASSSSRQDKKATEAKPKTSSKKGANSVKEPNKASKDKDSKKEKTTSKKASKPKK